MGCVNSTKQRTKEKIRIEDVSQSFCKLRNTPIDIKALGLKCFSQLLVKAIYSYDKQFEHELSFKQDDTMIIVDKTNKDWWIAKTRCEEEDIYGYVPVSYLAEFEKGRWFIPGLTRQAAEKILLNSNNEVGSYLIRPREITEPSTLTKIGCSISIKWLPQEIKHYKIEQEVNYNDQEKKYIEYFFINSNVKFRDIDTLLNYYKHAEGLVCFLKDVGVIRKSSIRDLGHTFQDFWEIDRSQLQFIRKLGTGNFGDVLEGVWLEKHRVAIKALKQGSLKPSTFLEEADLMKKLKHPNLVQLLAVCTKSEPVYIVLEYMCNGNLLDYIRKYNLSVKILIDMSCQCACGMEYLQTLNIVHRDLAARNVLVGGNNICKISDFGLSRIVNEEGIYKASKSTKFPVRWTAPEAMTLSKFTAKSDVWSFGILLYEIFSRGKTPYSGWLNREVVEHVDGEGYRLPRPSECPEAIYQLMRDCWHEISCKRPDFKCIGDELGKVLTSMV